MWSRIKNFFERLSRQRRKKQLYGIEAELRKNLLELGQRYNFDPIKEEEKFRKHWTQVIKQSEKKMKKKA